MNPGDVINLTHFEHYQPSIRTGWKPPKGKVFIAVLLGLGDKAVPEAFDVGRAMRALGWVPSKELSDARPDL